METINEKLNHQKVYLTKDADDLIRKFFLRPKKYAGKTFHIEGVLRKHASKAKPKHCSILGLEMGNTIQSQLEREGYSWNLLMFAQGEIADRLECFDEGQRVSVFLKCIFTLKEEVECETSWYDCFRAFELMEILPIEDTSLLRKERNISEHISKSEFSFLHY